MYLIKNRKKEIGRMALIIIAAIALLLTPLFSYADTEDVAEKDPAVENTQNNQITEEENVDGTFEGIPGEEENVDGILEERPEEDPLLRSGTASQYNTWILDGRDDTWKQNNTSNNKVGNLKETNRSVYTVRTAAKTMITAPQFRLVDSDGKVSSKPISLPAENTTYTGENSGKKGKKYYASLKPSPNQMNKDSITLKFNPQ